MRTLCRFRTRIAPVGRTAPVERTAHGLRALAHDVRVDHGGLEIRVDEKLLHRADVVTIFEQVGGKGVPQRVTAGGLSESRLTHGRLHGSLHGLLMQVMAHRYPCVRIAAERGRGEKILPTPLRARVRRSEEHTSELQSRFDLVCRLLLEKKKKK